MIENRKLGSDFRSIRSKQDVIEVKMALENGYRRKCSGYVLLHMVMNRCMVCVRNTRGSLWFVVGPKQPVPLSEEEMRSMGIKTDEEVLVDFEVGDTVTVVSGVWENTTGVIKQINTHKQIVTINVDMFGRETPVEISFNDVKVRK